MNVKRVSGFVAIVLGVALFWFGVHAQGKVSHAKESMSEVSSLFPKDQVSSSVENRMHDKLSHYDMMIRWSKIGGIVLVIVGVFAVIRYRKS